MNFLNESQQKIYQYLIKKHPWKLSKQIKHMREFCDLSDSILQDRIKIQLYYNQKEINTKSTMHKIQLKNSRQEYFDQFTSGNQNLKMSSSSESMQNEENELNQKILNFFPRLDPVVQVESACQNDQSNAKWTREESQKFIQLYLVHGPSWKFIASQLKSNIFRSQKEVKNKYNNSLKRTARILNKHEGKIYKNARRSITIDLLKSMMEFVNLLENTIKEYDLTPNYESKFFMFREQILRFSILTQDHYNESQLNDFIQTIKSLNSKTKCYGVFKKSVQRKVCKIKINALLSINQFDKILIQQASQLMSDLQNSSKEVKTSYQNIFNQGDDEDGSQMEISLKGIQSYCNNYLKDSTDLERQYFNILGEQYNLPDEQLLYLL